MNDISDVERYVNGGDITEQELEAFESDPSFMKLAVLKDPGLYDRCPDEVKLDYEVVRFIVENSKYGIKDICRIVDNYLNKNLKFDSDDTEIDNEIDINSFELLIIMIEKTRKLVDAGDLSYMSYGLLAESIYSFKMAEVEAIRSDGTDIDRKDTIEHGFDLLYVDYGSSPIIMNYIARKMVDDRLDVWLETLQYDLHNTFSSPKQLEKIGVINYFLSRIEQYDGGLALYLRSHPDLCQEVLRNAIDRVKKIIYNWSSYEEERYDILRKRLEDYKKKSNFSSCNITIEAMAIHAVRELDIPINFDRYSSWYTLLVDAVYHNPKLYGVQKIMEDHLSKNNVFDSPDWTDFAISTITGYSRSEIQKVDDRINEVINSSEQLKRVYNDIKKIVDSTFNFQHDNDDYDDPLKAKIIVVPSFGSKK